MIAVSKNRFHNNSTNLKTVLSKILKFRPRDKRYSTDAPTTDASAMKQPRDAMQQLRIYDTSLADHWRIMGVKSRIAAAGGQGRISIGSFGTSSWLFRANNSMAHVMRQVRTTVCIPEFSCHSTYCNRNVHGQRAEYNTTISSLLFF